MLRFFKPSGARRAPLGTIPAGLRVYAIGDIHGRLDLLDTLLATIDADDTARPSADTHLVFLGDLIDRGPNSCGVVDRVMALVETAGPRLQVIMGNHEEMLLSAMAEKAGRSQAMRLLYRNGGRETLLSYGIAEDDCDRADFDELREIARAHIPEPHLAFMRGMGTSIAFGDYLFVHAGVRPGVPLAEQRTSDLRWIRKDFLDSRANHGAIIVHGHTITQDVDLQPNRIGIDTGAYDSGALTAMGIEGGERWFLST